MRSYWILSLIIVAGLMSSCSLPEATPRPYDLKVTATVLVSPYPSHELLATPTWIAKPTITPLIVNPTMTNPAILPPEHILRYQPLDIAPGLPKDANPTGVLVLRSISEHPSYRLDFSQHRDLDFPENTSCLSTAPDGMWFTYCQGTTVPFPSGWLFIESVEGKRSVKLPIAKNWGEVFSNLTWLDNQRLALNLLEDTPDYQSPILPVLVINPFSGDQQVLASDYPDLRPSGSGPGGSLPDFLLSTVVYHPSLNLVVYPQTTDEGFFIVLWDRQAQQVVAKVKDLGGFGNYPIWTKDGEQFAIAVIPQPNIPSSNFSELREEWFSVSREGQIEQLTRFGELFDHAEIGFANWSPDGQHLAFWLATEPNLCAEETQPYSTYLAVLELETREVTNYCIPTIFGDDPPPIWSLDGQYLAVESRENGSQGVILVDVKQGWAAQIGTSAIPMGWLATP